MRGGPHSIFSKRRPPENSEILRFFLALMWGHMKIGDHTDLSVALVCPICPDQVLYPADYEQMLLNRECLENVQFTKITPSIQHLEPFIIPSTSFFIRTLCQLHMDSSSTCTRQCTRSWRARLRPWHWKRVEGHFLFGFTLCRFCSLVQIA